MGDHSGSGRPNTELRADFEALCRRFGLADVYAFGSRGEEVAARVRGEPDAGGVPRLSSDIDIGVRPVTGVRWGVDDKVHLAIALEDLFGCGRVDVVVLPEADPFLAAEIIRGERVYSRDEYEADEYDLYVLRRAGDLIPLERERLALITRGQP